MDGVSSFSDWDDLPGAEPHRTAPRAEHYEAIVVGAGPAGNAAALTLARAGIDVLQVDRGGHPAGRRLQGSILYAPALEELLPDFRSVAPLERRIVGHWGWTLDDRVHAGIQHQPATDSNALAARYTVLRPPFDTWLSALVKQAGAQVIYNTTVVDLLREEDGRVIGVHTDQDERPIYASIVILADGVEALIARRTGLREELEPLDVALTVKEMRHMPREALESRFGLTADDGIILEANTCFGDGQPSVGFIYTNRESLTVGIGCLVSDVVSTDITPSELLDRFKHHPSIRPLLEGSEMCDAEAQLFPEGGYRVRPRLFGDGWVTCGDATQRNEAMHRDGATMALTSGMLAAETIVELRRHGRPMTARHLSLYRDKLERSTVLRDVKRLRFPLVGERSHGRSIAADPYLLSQATDSLARCHGSAQRDRQKEVLRKVAPVRTAPVP